MKMKVMEKFLTLACNKQNSVDTYTIGMRLFCELLETTPETIVEEWNKVRYDYATRERFLDKWISIIDDFKAILKKKGYTESTINTYLAVVKSFFKKMRIPIGEIEYEPHLVRFHNRDISKSEIRTIIENSNLRDRAFYLMMKDSGIRPDTLCKLRYKHIKEDFEVNRIPMLIRTPLETLKIKEDIGRANERFSFIGEEAFYVLKEYLKSRGELKDDDYIFVRVKHGKNIPIGTKAPSWNFGKRVLKLGIAEKIAPKKPKQIRMYCLRKFFRNNMKCDPHYIQYWMSHKLDQSDIHYISRDIERHREEYMKGYDGLRIFKESQVSSETVRRELSKIDFSEMFKSWILTQEGRQALAEVFKETVPQELYPIVIKQLQQQTEGAISPTNIQQTP